jgi:hypothetical protein
MQAAYFELYSRSKRGPKEMVLGLDLGTAGQRDLDRRNQHVGIVSIPFLASCSLLPRDNAMIIYMVWSVARRHIWGTYK